MKASILCYETKIDFEIFGNHQDFTYKTLKNAFEIIEKFIKTYNLDVKIKALKLKKVVVYDQQLELKKTLLKEFNVNRIEDLPMFVSGTVINDTLYSLSKKEFEVIFPEEGSLDDGYLKLMVHELAHLLHIDLLKGKEDLMGPKWFYEGFATFVSNQFLNQTYESSFLIDIIENNKDVRYTYYADLFRKLMKYHQIDTMINSINNENYIQKLKESI